MLDARCCKSRLESDGDSLRRGVRFEHISTAFRLLARERLVLAEARSRAFSRRVASPGNPGGLQRRHVHPVRGPGPGGQL